MLAIKPKNNVNNIALLLRMGSLERTNLFRSALFRRNADQIKRAITPKIAQHDKVNVKL